MILSMIRQYQYWVLAAILVLVLAIIGVMGMLVPGGPRKVSPSVGNWLECKTALPDGTGEVALVIRHAHEFLAEYERKLRIMRG